MPLFNTYDDELKLSIRQNEKIFNYFIKSLQNSIEILISKVIYREQFCDDDKNGKSELKIILQNLKEIIEFLKSIITKSKIVYEFTFKLLLDLLAGFKNEANYLNQHVYVNRLAEVFKCFQIEFCVTIFVNYLNVSLVCLFYPT